MGNTQGKAILCWLALARVKIGSATLLRARRREGNEPIAVQGRVKRLGVADVPAGFSIRAACHPTEDTIGLGWFKQIGRWKKPQSSTLGAGDVRILERGQDLVIAAAFANEGEARAWLQARHTHTLPEWEPK